MSNTWVYRLLLLAAVIVIPWIARFSWTFTAWSAAGTCAILFGFALQNKDMIKFGVRLFTIGAVGFFLWDWMRDWKYAERYYTYKYTLISLQSILITACYLIARQQAQTSDCSGFRYGRTFTYFTIINTWMYLLHLSGVLFISSVPRWLYYEFYKVLCMAFIHFTAGYGVVHIPLVTDNLVRILGKIFYLCGIVQVLWIDFSFSFIQAFFRLQVGDIAAAGVFILMNGFMLLAGREVISAIRLLK